MNPRTMLSRHSLISVLGTISATLALVACGPAEQAAEPAVAPTPAAQPPTVVLYEGARLILGNSSAPVENGAFSVDDGRFVAVGAAGSVSVPDGATRVNLSGMTVMPAIVDAHTHMSTTRA